jgi:hypothetical protein
MCWNALTPGTGEFMEAVFLCQAFPAQKERRSKFRMITIVIGTNVMHLEPPPHFFTTKTSQIR